MRLGVAGLCALAAAWLGGAAAAAVPTAVPTAMPAAAPAPSLPASSPVTHRPRIGLVLSGGGARGLAHVGVLKVLEREHVPIDVIAGTSMGSIIGGLYASGMSATELEAELLKVNWGALFSPRVERQQLSERRKEEDFEISPVLEIGMRNGELTLPVGSVSSRGLELLLRRYTLGARAAKDFDSLPIRFRAVATDMENGRAVVFKDGDLATALRASMSVPGLFAPTDVNGRILGDGGLVDNLPVDVIRAMGAEVVIAVNIGTPLAPRDTLGSLLGVTSQMINILTEQNVQRSLEQLDPERDLLIAPTLGVLTSGDFDKTREFIERGEQYAETLRAKLARWSLPDAQWQALLAERASKPAPPPPITQVRFEGNQISNPERLAAELESRVGQPFDVAAAERDTRALAASGDYLRTDYRLEDLPAGTGLVFNLEEKPWGPNYFRVGLGLATDFAGQGDFNIKISHNRHWLNANAAEWRNRLQIGSVPRIFSEWYQPLNWTSGLSTDWFVAPYLNVERRQLIAYQPIASGESGKAAVEVGRYTRSSGRFGIDLGQPWGRYGELRLGVVRETLRIDPDIVAAQVSLPLESQRVHEWGVRLGAVVDQLDYAIFPTYGYRIDASEVIGRRWNPLLPGGTETFDRFELQASAVGSLGRHTLDAHLRVLTASRTPVLGVGYYTLGGFQNLSGYKTRQLSGNDVALARLIYRYRLTAQPVLTRGFFAGATLEAGNAWQQRGDIRLGDLRTGMSVFLGADTGLGPLYFGVAYAPLGATNVFLVLGRP